METKPILIIGIPMISSAEKKEMIDYIKGLDIEGYHILPILSYTNKTTYWIKYHP